MDEFEGITLWQAAALHLHFRQIQNPAGDRLYNHIQMKSNYSQTRPNSWVDLFDAINSDDVQNIRRYALEPQGGGEAWPENWQSWEEKVRYLTQL